jgi:hypothetical protein
MRCAGSKWSLVVGWGCCEPTRPVGTATVFGQATPGGWLTLTFRRYNKSPVAVGDVAPVAHRAHSRSCSADADHGNLFGRLDGISRTWPR